MVRGINTTLYEHLKDKISVHSWARSMSIRHHRKFYPTLLRAESGWFQAMENQGNSCGQDSETLKAGEAALNLYVRMIVDARQLRQAPSPMSKPFRGTAGITAFLNVLRNPLASIMASSASITSSLFKCLHYRGDGASKGTNSRRDSISNSRRNSREIRG